MAFPRLLADHQYVLGSSALPKFNFRVRDSLDSRAEPNNSQPSNRRVRRIPWISEIESLRFEPLKFMLAYLGKEVTKQPIESVAYNWLQP